MQHAPHYLWRACLHCVCVLSIQVAREAEFPLQFISAGLAPRLRESHAASEQDKRALLATIADMPPLAPARPGADAGGDADACVGIERALAGRMAVAAMRRVFDSGESALLNKCATSLAASGLRVVALNMSSCAAFTTATAELLAANLPCTIEYLSLHLNDVLAAAADAFVDGVAARLPSQLRRMRDICLYSNVLGENGCFALNRALRYASPALRTLDFGMPCPFRDVRVQRSSHSAPRTQLHAHSPTTARVCPLLTVACVLCVHRLWCRCASPTRSRPSSRPSPSLTLASVSLSRTTSASTALASPRAT